MSAALGNPDPLPFFLGSGAESRFCLFHQPAGACRGAFLYIHPFAEELNRTRRMAALQARRLAASGYGVLQIDLHGCGDSAGDFGDARWDGWKRDLAAAADWLHVRLGRPIGLWGLRLGALLALDYARTATHHLLGPMLLWQPVTNGAHYLTQFLRLRTAQAMLDGGNAPTGTRALLKALEAGETVEVAGYDLAPELASAIAGFDRLDALVPTVPVHWFSIQGAGQPAPADVVRTALAWRALGGTVTTHMVDGPPFWTTPEIATSPALLEATVAALEAYAHAP